MAENPQKLAESNGHGDYLSELDSEKESVLRVRNLSKFFPVKKGFFGREVAQVRAVDDVSFFLRRKETLGLVGESGCGKTTTGRLILQLIRPSQGQVSLLGSENLVNLSSRQLLPYRRKMQMIFQDPYSSLNPRMTVGSIIGEALTIHKLAAGAKKTERIQELLREVGLNPGAIKRFPHEFSGGQRQRIGIARALAVEPQVIIADEPVSALDVSIQSQIINLLQRLQEEYGLSFVFIAHDLSVVGHISHRVAVMYLGKIAEIGPKMSLFDGPRHPYTQALLAAVPKPNPEKKGPRAVLQGDVPSPINPPPGCSFHPRCPFRFGPCDKVAPRLLKQAPEHFVACHLYDPEFKSQAPVAKPDVLAALPTS
ncbi:MAG: ATP-binding cassette domain-containing protein [Candidatus Sumerlaeaceae bacterium]|nr:ATP-binding cassette domain-containing protein [Candidatus Sumerlaeaceae bacterium]